MWWLVGGSKVEQERDSLLHFILSPPFTCRSEAGYDEELEEEEGGLEGSSDRGREAFTPGSQLSPS